MTRAAAIVMAMAGMMAEGASASDERGLFHLPGEDDFRTQLIERNGNEDGWPFSADAGHLMCAYVTGRPTVYFVEQAVEDSDADPRVVVVTTDPLDLAFVNAGKAELFAPHKDIAELIRLIGPFQSLGQRLCDQPRGSTIGRGEL